MKTIVKAFALLLFAAASLQAQVPSRLADTTAKIQADIWVAQCRKNVKVLQNEERIKGAKRILPRITAQSVYFPETGELYLGAYFDEPDIVGSTHVDYDEIVEVLGFLEEAKALLNGGRGFSRLEYRFAGGLEIKVLKDGSFWDGTVWLDFPRHADAAIDQYRKVLEWLDGQKALQKK